MNTEHISTLSLKVFDGSSNLRKISLSNNQLREIIQCDNGVYLRWCQSHTLLFVALVFISLCFGIFIAWMLSYEYGIKVWLYAQMKSLMKSIRMRVKDMMHSFHLCKLMLWICDGEMGRITQVENGPIPFNVCLHTKDWPADEFIADLIYKSIKDSHRVIFVLSKEFLTTIWLQVEFHAAHKFAIGTHKVPIIFVTYDKGYWIWRKEPGIQDVNWNWNWE